MPKNQKLDVGTLEKDVRLKYLLDCHEDFYLPTMNKRFAIQQLYENMIQGRCDATFMFGHAPPMFNESNTFTTMEFLHSATKLNMSIRSQTEGLRGFTWRCDVLTYDRDYIDQVLIDNGVDEEEYYDDGDGAIIHTFDVETGRILDLPLDADDPMSHHTPECLKSSWIRAFPTIKREIQKLKRCKVCKKARVQSHTKCPSCIISD